VLSTTICSPFIAIFVSAYLFWWIHGVCLVGVLIEEPISYLDPHFLLFGTSPSTPHCNKIKSRTDQGEESSKVVFRRLVRHLTLSIHPPAKIMPPKRQHRITKYIDSDDESPTPQPPLIIQTHTHIHPTSRGLSTSNLHYEMPSSPLKRHACTANEAIAWRDDDSEPMSLPIYSDDEDDNMDDAERMLEPGYVSTVRDDRVKRKRGFLGVSCSTVLFYLWQLKSVVG